MLAAEDIDGLLDIAHARLGCTGTGVRSCWKKQVQQDLHGHAGFLALPQKAAQHAWQDASGSTNKQCINAAASNDQLCKGAHASLSAGLTWKGCEGPYKAFEGLRWFQLAPISGFKRQCWQPKTLMGCLTLPTLA